MRVTDADVEAEYRRRNEKVKLDVAVFNADKLKTEIKPTDAELAQRFSASQETYRVPEKRRVRFLRIDPEALRAKMSVTPQEVEARYRESIQTYSTPEQVRASHILLKTEGKDEAAVRKVAEGVLAKVKAGGDFAALAKQYLRRRRQQGRGWRPRLLRPGRHGEGIRGRGLGPSAGTDERSRQDAVRLPHHSG